MAVRRKTKWKLLIHLGCTGCGREDLYRLSVVEKTHENRKRGKKILKKKQKEKKEFSSVVSLLIINISSLSDSIIKIKN